MTTNIGTPLTFKCSETIRLRRVKPEESPTAYATLQPTGRQNLPQRPVRSKGHSTSRQMNLTKENTLSRETKKALRQSLRKETQNNGFALATCHLMPTFAAERSCDDNAQVTDKSHYCQNLK